MNNIAVFVFAVAGIGLSIVATSASSQEPSTQLVCATPNGVYQTFRIFHPNVPPWTLKVGDACTTPSGDGKVVRSTDSMASPNTQPPPEPPPPPRPASSASAAQGLVQLDGPWLPQAQVLSQDPTFGPMCQGPAGPAPCLSVRYFMAIQARLAQIHPRVVGPGTCAGPLGPGPCFTVALWMAKQDVASNIQIAQVAVDPTNGPICPSPFGNAPCPAVKLLLLDQALGVPPPINLSQIRITNPSGPSGAPLCGGPTGPVPCSFLQQQHLDGFGGGVPLPSSFNLPIGITSSQQRAKECAKQTRMDVVSFSGCMGQQVVLPKRQQQMLDCAMGSRTTPEFANCAAPKLGIELSEKQRKLAQCAMRVSGDSTGFASCAGSAFMNRPLTRDETAVLNCAKASQGNAQQFVACATPQFLSQSQNELLGCAIEANDAGSFAACAATGPNIPVSDDQRTLVKCAMQSKGDKDGFFQCAGSSFLGGKLSQDQQAVLNCAATTRSDAKEFAQCAAFKVLGQNLSQEQTIALQCAAESKGDMQAMATCAGANLFNMNLNPEQQIAVQCVVQTGGQPYAAAGCMASRLTARELTKCLTDGVGGKGCFGDSNDLVGRNGFVARTFVQIAGGPNSVVNNPGQIWGGANSFVRNPGQIWGGNNSFVRNPGQFWGGNNSVFNNPGQLLPKPPPPVTLGTVGDTRICFPWC